jgi:CRP/FNR family transcriptional regulator, cyclic AMP receptor protein
MTRFMCEELSLSQRRRSPTEGELRLIPWLAALEPHHHLRACAALQVGDARAGDYVVRVGRPVTYWFGLIDGLLKMSNDTPDGRSITLTGVPPGGWFGEGTVLKQENYRYNIQALRPSVVAGIPVETFHWLLDQSIAFNRFVMNQLNERVAQFIAAREIDRMSNPEARVAAGLAALFNPVLYPGASRILRITQHELANLVGLSRQRVNQALRELELRQLVRIEYGGLRVNDLTALRHTAFFSPFSPPSKE